MPTPNKVFCLGLSRTGTTSLCSALQDLGYKTVHFPLCLFTKGEEIGLPKFFPKISLPRYKQWRRNKEIKALAEADISMLLSEYDAFGDLPIPLYYKHLHRLYPDAKFILTSRSLDKWLISMRWLFDKGGLIWRRGLIGDELHYAVYGTTTYNEKVLSESFLSHLEEVESYFLGSDSSFCHLVIDKGDLTYDKLKEFLSIKTDLSGPCPHVNEAKDISWTDYIDYYYSSSPFSIITNRIKRFFLPSKEIF